jgi:uncharacterized protein YkwD
VPRTLGHAFWFLLGLWVALTLIGPIGARGAGEQDPELARLEHDLFVAVNGFRTSEHLVTLERRGDLDRVARAHSEDMVRRGFFAHQNPDGEMWWQRVERGGVTGFTMVGENVAQTNQGDPNRAVLEGWKASPAHRENLMARPYNATGVGIARHPDGRLFYTQLYASFPH